MADGGALSLSERLEIITHEETSIYGDRPKLSELVGCIFWLKAADQTRRHLRYNLSKDACDHPCLVVDVSPERTGQARTVRIFIITSFKKKSPTERAIALRKRPNLVPIFPNITARASTSKLQLQPDVTLRRDSWVNLANSFVVDATMIKKYDNDFPWLHYKLAPSSTDVVRSGLGLPALRRSSTTRVETVQAQVVHVTPKATIEPSPHFNHEVVVQRQDRQSERTTLVKGTARRFTYGATHTYSEIVPRDGQRDEEAYRWRQTLPIPAYQGSELGAESQLLRLYQSPPSWRRVRSWLPSSQTVTALVVTAVLLAAGGGVGYGGYLVIKVICTAIGALCHEIAGIGAKGLSAVVGAWRWCANIVQGLGQGIVKAERTIIGAVEKAIAIVKALLGRL